MKHFLCIKINNMYILQEVLSLQNILRKYYTWIYAKKASPWFDSYYAYYVQSMNYYFYHLPYFQHQNYSTSHMCSAKLLFVVLYLWCLFCIMHYFAFNNVWVKFKLNEKENSFFLVLLVFLEMSEIYSFNVWDNSTKTCNKINFF